MLLKSIEDVSFEDISWLKKNVERSVHESDSAHSCATEFATAVLPDPSEPINTKVRDDDVEISEMKEVISSRRVDRVFGRHVRRGSQVAPEA